MGVGDILGEMGVNIGSVGGGSFIRDVVILLLLLVVAGIFTYWYLNKKSYNKTIVKFREINGLCRRVGTEKAKEIVLPGTSIRAYYLRSSKFFLPRPSIETGNDEYWFFIRDDGEWMNIGVGNVNQKLREMDVKFDHTDMRMANAALKRLVDKSYKKGSWIKEYAPYIAMGILVIMLSIAVYIPMQKGGEVTGAAAANVETFKEITETMNDILVNINNIASTSGARPAG